MAEAALKNDLEIDQALSRSVFYQALAMSLRPPCLKWLLQLAGDDALQAVRDAARAQPQEILASAVGELLLEARRATVEELDQAYQCLFGHVARGKVPPYETEYGCEDLFRQSEELADINGFYQAFGLRVLAAKHERADHISAECEFLSFLAAKEAYDLEEGHQESWEEVRRAGRLFVRDHLARFGRAFARSLAEEADHPFYRAVGNFCFALLTSEYLRLGIPPGPEFAELRPAKEEEVPMACSSSCPLMTKDSGNEPDDL